MNQTNFPSIEQLANRLFDADSTVLDEAQCALSLQKLLFNKEKWTSINNNRGKIVEALSIAYPSLDWQKILVNGQPIWRVVNELNEAVLCQKTTPGGRGKREQVIARQQLSFNVSNGEFCVYCGTRQNLQVDHIIAVNTGGVLDDHRNLQLLCSRCNSAKNSTFDFDVRIAFRVSDEESELLRYRVLYDRRKQVGGYSIGCCEVCGAYASYTELVVQRRCVVLAFAYSNLIVTCKKDHS